MVSTSNTNNTKCVSSKSDDYTVFFCIFCISDHFTRVFNQLAMYNNLCNPAQLMERIANAKG